jgi:hypothetical protein
VTESDNPYERLRRAERELGEPDNYVVKPIEETEEMAEAADDEAPLRDLGEE